MGLNFKIEADNEDITERLKSHIQSIKIKDKAGLESDTLSLVVADDPLDPWAPPERGVELRIYMGRRGEQPLDMGTFICDTPEVGGPPWKITIKAHAAPFRATSSGASTLLKQRRESYDSGITIGDLVGQIADRHGLGSAVSSSLSGVTLPHIDQVDESDMHLLTRVGRRHGALIKPAAGNLVAVKRGSGVSADGSPMPEVTFREEDVSAMSVKYDDKWHEPTAIAKWRDYDSAQTMEVSSGSGKQTIRLPSIYPDEATAKAAAEAAVERRRQGSSTISIKTAGTPEAMAEAIIITQGFYRPEFNGEWVATEVSHSMGTGGFTTSISAEVSG